MVCLWICAGKRGNTYDRVAIRRNAPHFHGKSATIGTLQDGIAVYHCSNLNSLFKYFCIFFLLIIGATVIFAQLPIDQFRSVGWFNVVVGMATILTQMLVFKGEMKCNIKLYPKIGSYCSNKSIKTSKPKKHSTSKAFTLIVSSTNQN